MPLPVLSAHARVRTARSCTCCRVLTDVPCHAFVPAAACAVPQVWASQWGDRAWLSRQACQVPEGDLKMSVLLQEVRGVRVWGCVLSCNASVGRGPACVTQWGAPCAALVLTHTSCCVTPSSVCPCVLSAVLQVADGSYAFVLHTANPLTGQLGEMFGELVPGLGEVLVSHTTDLTKQTQDSLS
jgi:hypothetical protein